jgi:Holliday junction resolvase-like predicted endonuclease
VVRGNLGERLATDALATQGHAVLSFKPSILGTNQGGIDIVTIRNGVVHLIDNKALTRSGNVSSVSALTTNFAQNLAAVRQGLTTALARPGISQSEQQILQQAIGSIDRGNVVRAVTNANWTPDDKILSGVTQTLQNQGIEFIDVFQ